MNREDHLRDPAAALRTFSAGLGDLAPDWAAREELEQLRYVREDFSRDVAAGLTPEHLVPLAEAYGDALQCRFLLGSMPVLEVAPDLDEAALDAFREATQDSPTVIFEFTLNKQALLKTWLEEMGRQCRPFLYLFPRALERFLKVPPDTLGDLERLLWGKRPAQKVVILVPDHDVWLDGPYLAVIGGDGVGRWRQVLPPQGEAEDVEIDRTGENEEEADDEGLSFIIETRASTLKWDEPWVESLTPRHLELAGDRGPDDVPIASLLEAHLVNLVLLHTADRSRRQDGQLWATYAGAQHSVRVPLLETDRRGVPVEERAPALLRIFEWAYDPHFHGDKLPLVQIAVAQALHAADAAVRTRLLLQNVDAIYEGLQYHWKALIERKVDAYVGQVQALETIVSETAQAFADQITAMIDDLMKNMLAAVGVVVGSFIGSLFKDTFNAAVFSLGMFVYALYVGIFPLAFGMANRWEAYEALREEFVDRRERFEALLYKGRVKEIVGSQIRDSQARFERWFTRVRRAYVALIAVAILAGVLALAIGPATSPATTTLTSPTATPTVAAP